MARFAPQFRPNTPPGVASVLTRSPGKTRRDHDKPDPPLRDLRAMCAAAGQRPAATDTESLMNARLRGGPRRKIG